MLAKIKEKQIPMGIMAPFISEWKDEDMELVAFEKTDNFITMTFVFKCFDEIVEIPGKGKMLFSMALRYYKPQDDALKRKLFRKIANLPLIRSVAGNFGTTGKWVVFNYSYKYNLKDYYDWAVNEGDGYMREQIQKNNEFFEQLKSADQLISFEKEINKQLEFEYAWGELALEEQASRIDMFYKIRAEN